MAQRIQLDEQQAARQAGTAQAAGALTVINGETLRSLIPIPDAIDLVEQAMIALSSGVIIAPERWALGLTGGDKMGFMPGAAPAYGVFGAKLISLFKNGPGPSHQGLMLLFDLGAGAPKAVVDGETLTGLRTAAATAVATRALSLPGADSVAFLGCGGQARWHVDALLAVRPIRAFHLWSRTRASAEGLAREIGGRDLPVSVTIHDSAEAAARAGEIVCALTGSREPVLKGEWLRPGQHVNLVGSSTRESRELDEPGVRLAWYIADDRAHALSQGGELRRAIEAGLVDQDHVRGEIGEVLSGLRTGRPSPEAITLYKSLGHVAQDLAVAHAALARAHDQPTVPRLPW